MILVTHIISGLKVGGAEMAMYRLIVHSRNHGFKHRVISLSPGGGMNKILNDANIELFILDFRKSPVSSFWSLIKFLKISAPNIVQTWMYHADFLGGLASRIAGIRSIIWGVRTTDVNGSGSISTKLIRRFCSFLSHVIPHTIVCAAESSRKSHVQLGYDSVKMTVIPNGFDLDRLKADKEEVQNLKKQCGFSENDIVIGCVGRFNSDKDQENFVNAAGLLHNHYPNARFLMVGRDCDVHNSHLMKLISTAGISDKIILLGERSDIPVCLDAMDIFCLSSRTEGFPNVVGEAMSMKKPCVVTDVGDAAFLLGKGGIVVPKESPKELSDGLKKLLIMEKSERIAIGQMGYDRIINEFTMEKTKQKFIHVYANVLSKQ